MQENTAPSEQEQELDFDDFELSAVMEQLEGVEVEGGVDAELDDASCPGGACKI